MNFEGTIGKYGKVFVTHTLYALEGDKSRGSLEGNARAILDDGTLLWSPLTGTFRLGVRARPKNSFFSIV